MSIAVAAPPGFTLRRAVPADRDALARICFEAFAGIHDRHRFPRDFPSLDAARELVEAFIAHPRIWGVVAEVDGRVAGSNFLDERGPVAGIGPITVDPAEQAAGVGRALMEAVIERGKDALGLRLQQDAFNTRSLALYTSLGFDVVEPVALLEGHLREDDPGAVRVRPLEAGDLAAAGRLHVRVHGHERSAELRDALGHPRLRPTIAERDGRVVAYAATLTEFGAAHAVAERWEDLAGLIAGTLALQDARASFLLPTRQAELFRWLLAGGLRVVKPMSYMARGHREPPRGAWLPSVLA